MNDCYKTEMGNEGAHKLSPKAVEALAALEPFIHGLEVVDITDIVDTLIERRSGLRKQQDATERAKRSRART